MLDNHRWTLFTSNRNDELNFLFNGLNILLDEEGVLLQVPEELSLELGYSTVEMINRPLSDFLKRPNTFEEVLAERGSGKNPLLELVSGAGHPVTYSFHVIRAREGDVERYIIALLPPKDGTRYNLLQRFAGAFLKDVNLGVMLINTEFELVDISDTACRVLGICRNQAIGRSLDEVFAEVPDQHRLVQRSLLDGVIVKNYAVSWTNDRERYELILDSNLLKDPSGRVVGAYVMFKDVSNLRSLEQQVQRSDRLAMIGQIAAGTAHEIRNPLTSIKGFMQILKKSLRDRDMEKEFGYTELMLGEVERINELISEFLLLSKQRNTTFTKLGVTGVIQEIMPIIRSEAILYNVIVNHECAPELPPIIADRELLKQMFINLCKNSIEAMAGEGGVLTITEKVNRSGEFIHISVKDTGPGIPPFLIDKIFDPFFTTKGDGTGLGLAVCQRIVHDIGGTLRVSSKGYGTVFIVSIPYVSE